MTNSMELFSSLFKGEIPKRVPLAINMIDQGAIEMNMTMENYYSKAEYVAEGQIKLKKKYDHDIVWGLHYLGRLAEMLGSKKTIYPKLGAPNVGDLIIKNWDDIEKLEIPNNIEEIPAFKIQADTIKLLNEEFGGTCPVAVGVTGSFSTPAILMGVDKWLELLLMGPEELKNLLLQKCNQFVGTVTNAFFKAGVTMVVYANSICTVDFFTPKKLEEIAIPWIVNDTKLTGTNGMVYFNGGGRINPIIDSLITKAGFGVIYTNPLDDVTESKKIVNGRALLASPINDIPLIHQSAKEIRAEVKRIIKAGYRDGGFIFGTLVMPAMIPEQNIHTLIEAAKEFGNYNVNEML